METSLDTDPTVRVELLNILSSSLMSLGETATAESVSEGALEEARANLSPDDPLALRAGLLRSWVMMYRGKTSEARTALDEVFAAVERGLALPAEDLVLAWRVRCGLDIDAVNREEAVTAGEEAVRLADERLRDDHPEKLLALLELAYAHQQARSYEKALAVAQRAYGLAAAVHPNNALHPNVIKARARLGNALADVGQLERGIGELEQAVLDASSVFGPSSMTVGVYLQNLVSYQLRAGMVRAALESSRRSLEICERYFEPDSLTRISCAQARGVALMAARRISESLATFEDAYDAATRTYGPSDRMTLELRLRRALALAHTGAVAEARREVQVVMEEAERSNVVDVYTPLRFRGRIERLEGNFAAALDLQERALERIVDSPGSFRLALTFLEIGMLKVELGSHEDAITALEEAGRRLGEDGRVDPDDSEVLIGLGRAKLGQGRASKALAYLEEADLFWKDFDPENRWAGEVSLWLSECYASLGRLEEAEEARKRARRILSLSADPADARLVSIVEKKRASP